MFAIVFQLSYLIIPQLLTFRTLSDRHTATTITEWAYLIYLFIFLFHICYDLYLFSNIIRLCVCLKYLVNAIFLFIFTIKQKNIVVLVVVVKVKWWMTLKLFVILWYIIATHCCIILTITVSNSNSKINKYKILTNNYHSYTRKL